jgi:hypothetical protein
MSYIVKESLCWSCDNAVPKTRDGSASTDYVKGCVWSIFKQPVKGWKAKRQTMKRCKGSKEPSIVSYHVTKCPYYIRSKKAVINNGKQKHDL